MKKLNIKLLFAAVLCSSFMGLQGASVDKLKNDLQRYKTATTPAQRIEALNGIAASKVVDFAMAKRLSRDVPGFEDIATGRSRDGVTIQEVARNLLAKMTAPTPTPTPATPTPAPIPTPPPFDPSIFGGPTPTPTPSTPSTSSSSSSSTTTSSSSTVSVSPVWKTLRDAIAAFKSNPTNGNYNNLVNATAAAKALPVPDRAQAEQLLVGLVGIQAFNTSSATTQPQKRAEARAAMVKVTAGIPSMTNTELQDAVTFALSGGTPPSTSTTPVTSSTSTSTTAPAKTAPSTPITPSPAKTTPSPAKTTPTPATSTPSVTPPAKTAAATGPLSAAELKQLDELRAEIDSSGDLSTPAKNKTMLALLTRAEQSVVNGAVTDLPTKSKIANARASFNSL